MADWLREEINGSSVLIVICGMYYHLAAKCLIGPCTVLGDMMTIPTTQSCLFCLAFCAFLANLGTLWPTNLRRPHITLVYMFELVTTLFLVDLAFKIIYDPLDECVRWSCYKIGSWIVATDDKLKMNNNISYVGKWLQSVNGYTNLEIILTLYFTYMVLNLMEFPRKVTQKYMKGAEFVCSYLFGFEKFVPDTTRPLIPCISISRHSTQSAHSISLSISDSSDSLDESDPEDDERPVYEESDDSESDLDQDHDSITDFYS